MELEYKKAKLEFKKEKEGSFRLIFATTNIKDHDNDVTAPGAFPSGKEIPMSAYQHTSWDGSLPVGKAVISEVGDMAIAEGEFFLNTTHGKDHYETIKALGDIQEYSYGYKPIEFEFGKFEGQDVRFLKKVNVFEISPVLKGAGIGTRTLSIKSEGTTYAEHTETVLAAVDELLVRTKSLADLRRDAGRQLSGANLEKLTRLEKSLVELLTYKTHTEESLKVEQVNAQKLFLELSKLKMNFMEVC